MGEMRDADWSRQNLLRSDWLGPTVATITTQNLPGLNELPEVHFEVLNRQIIAHTQVLKYTGGAPIE